MSRMAGLGFPKGHLSFSLQDNWQSPMIPEEKMYKDVSFGSYVVPLNMNFCKIKGHSIDNKWVQN